MNRSSMTLRIQNSDDMQIKDTTQDSHVTFNEQLVLTKGQYELLKIISNISGKSISEYIQKAVIETMKTEIEFGDFCDMLLDKLDTESKITDPVT